MIRAVFFDLDGTLVNSVLDLANCANKVLKNNGYKEQPCENYKFYAGGGIKDMLNRAAGGTLSEEKAKKFAAEFHEIYKNHFADNTVAYDGMKELLRSLKEKKMKLCVITNKPQDIAEQIIRKVYGEDLFDLIVGQNGEFPLKPQPHSSFYAMSEAEVNSDETFFVGDSAVDILTADNFGAFSVGVLWGFRTRAELEQAGARFIVNSPDEILKIINRINDI